MDDGKRRYGYPRRRVIRTVLRRLIDAAFAMLADMRISGKELIPREEPLLVVANHFSFIDPVAMIHTMPRPIEFLGGFRMPNAPSIVTWIPKLWGYYPVFRGTGSREGLRAAEAVLHQGGVLGVFPEAGSWATVLRPARPGTAFLAAQTGVRLLPMGFDGLPDLFRNVRRGRRGPVTVRIGQPFGPFKTTTRGRQRRAELDAIGQTIMEHIADLLPDERRGHFAANPAIRAAAQGTEIYPWDTEPEAI
ncbi:MAG: 1-acyl-sn-glycerol-3-phosphate acyltransferase [Anaerolineales bacterium]|nr:1-acyl-sn-glycerol-3-phosphate acyltransferase [Anaerolineales bacterium]